jgi:trans-aconitate methyltransferase
MLRGRPRPTNDSWIAACCLGREDGVGALNAAYVSTVVSDIDTYRINYYTQVGWAHAEVETVHPTGRRPYIRTKSDGSLNDNLLKLDRYRLF